MIEVIALAGIVAGFTQAIKKTNKVNEVYIPLVAVVIGIIVSGIATVGGSDFVLQGIIMGLSATGLYEATIDKLK
jgi:hypothetical protein